MNEHSFGVIPVWQTRDTYQVLLIKQKEGKWGFPKGREDILDTCGCDTARRELAEETGITQCDLRENLIFTESYKKVVADSYYQKKVVYYLGFVEKQDIVIQISEIEDYRWACYEDALDLLTFESKKNILREVDNLLLHK